MGDDPGNKWKKVVVVYFKVLSHCAPVGSDETKIYYVGPGRDLNGVICANGSYILLLR